MTVALGALVALAIVTPHLADPQRSTASLAALVWFCALVLRALTVIAAVLFLVLVLPTTQLFSMVTHWCWHTVLPVLATHLGLDGHSLGDAAIVLPVFFVAASIVWVGIGVLRATRKVSALMRHAELGPGPDGSVMVGGPTVVVAAAGLHRPKVVVSAGALLTLDDDELAASLDHERGHIARRHRFVLLAAQFLRAVARPLPGTRTAMRELVFHLERDADAWAVTRRNDRFALASAICKAATAALPTTSVATALGGGAATRRVRELVQGPPRIRSSTGSRLLASAMVALTLASVASVPAALAAGAAPIGERQRHCTP